MGTNEEAKPVMRRRHSKELESQLLAECVTAGASVAIAHRVDDNVVHKWRRHTEAVGSPAAAAFVPLTVAPPAVPSESLQFVDLEPQRGAISVRVR